MINPDILSRRLLDAIKRKIPDGVNIANLLTDILFIDKEAVYRRLRGQVAFSFYEVAMIARKLDISINDVVDIKTKKNEYHFHLRPQLFYNVDESHYPPLQAFIDSLKIVGKESFSEFVSCTNWYPPFPGHFFPAMFKLSAFKSMYEDVETGKAKLYKEIFLPEDYIDLNKDVIRETMNIKETSYIWKVDLLKETINEIKYFESLQLLDKESISLIKKDLYHFIDFIEETAIRGSYKLTGNKVYIYISNVNFDASYYYLESPSYSLSMVGAFSFNHITALDTDTLEIMKKKVQSLKRISTLISECNEEQRLKFLRTQREFINTL